jgi:serine/threonine protein kinase
MLTNGELLGSYRIIDGLNRGAMGVVYVAEHVLIGRKVALKLIAPELAAQPEAVRLFFREARAANQIAHPNIIQITDLVEGHGDDPCFMVMELLEGHTLGEVIEQEGRLPGARVIEVGVQVADAMAAAHEVGVIHRDLKPENIFLCNRGGDVKILDFGLAHLGSRRRRSRESTVIACGTPLYMSPEQAGSDTVDDRADIYSLGAVLYEAITGKPVFDYESVRDLMLAHISETPEPPSQTGVEVNAELEKLIMECLEKAPEARPRSMRQVAERLAAIGEGARTVTIEAMMADAFERASAELDRMLETFEREPATPEPASAIPTRVPARYDDTLMVRPLRRPQRPRRARRWVAGVAVAVALALAPLWGSISGLAARAAAELAAPILSIAEVDAAPLEIGPALGSAAAKPVGASPD